MLELVSILPNRNLRKSMLLEPRKQVIRIPKTMRMSLQDTALRIIIRKAKG